MAFATPTELKAQFIMPMSYERGRIRLQAQQKEASPPYRLVADLPFLSLCAASSPRPDWGGVRNAVLLTLDSMTGDTSETPHSARLDHRRETGTR